MKEKIEIKNFGGIKHLDMEVNSINVLIGPQASGKSVTAKLLYFFRNILSTLKDCINSNKSNREFNNGLSRKFMNYFPQTTWIEKDFYIRYVFGDIWFEIEKNTHLKISYSEEIQKDFKDFKLLYRELSKKNKDIEPHSEFFEWRSYQMITNTIQKKYSFPFASRQIFIPAGRSFFANVQSNVFTLLRGQQSFDPFMLEFGSLYENIKRMSWEAKTAKNKEKVDDLISQVLHGKYSCIDGEDYLIHEDNRKIHINFASSGQQETLPLAIILKHIYQIRHFSGGIVVYIEEPEAHLFPQSQKNIVELLAIIAKVSSKPFQFVITTHSPYILASFNNLIEAGNILEEYPEKKEEVYEIIPKEKVLRYDDLSVYSLDGGFCERIMDDELKLISPTILDEVSNDISVEFGKLLDL